MRSRIARDMSREAIGRTAESHAGTPRQVAPFGGSRIGNSLVSARYRLPVDAEELVIQNPDGSFVYLEGYDEAPE